MNCLNCKEEFEPKRSTALYCSDKCRKLAFLEVSVLAPEPVSVLEGVCHGCNEEVNKLVCICHLCIAKDITHESLGLKMCEA